MAALQVAMLLSIGLGHDSHLNFAAMVRVMATNGGFLELQVFLLAKCPTRVNPRIRTLRGGSVKQGCGPGGVPPRPSS